MAHANRTGDIIGLLAITILVDGKVHPSEPEEFRRQITRLKIFSTNIGERVPARELENWYAHNWEPLRAILDSANRGDHIRAALACITDRELASALFAAMCQIALADDELHRDETALLKAAARAWNIPL